MDSLTAFLNKRKKKTTPATNNAGSLSSLEKFLESRKNPPKPTKPALPKPTVQPVLPSYVKNTLPRDLGGGSYYSTPGQPNQLIRPEAKKTYGSLPVKQGQQRDHFIAQSLGGASDDYNLNYVPSEVNQKWGNIETRNLGAFNRGEISLPQARLNVLKEKQEWLLKQKGISQSVKDNLIQIAKDPINPVNIAKGVLKKITSPLSLVKDYAKALAPKQIAELEQTKAPDNKSMRFEVSNVEKVLPGPRISTLNAIQQGAKIEPVKVGEAPVISPERQIKTQLADEAGYRKEITGGLSSMTPKEAGVGALQALAGATRATSVYATLPFTATANLLSKEKVPFETLVDATVEMAEDDIKTGGKASTGEAAQMYLQSRGVGKYGGNEVNLGDIAVLATIGLGDTMGDPLFYYGMVKPALNQLKFATQFKKTGQVSKALDKGVKITQPQKSIVSLSDDLKIVVDPKSNKVTFKGYVRRGAKGEVLNQKAITGVVDDIAKNSGKELTTKVVGNDIILTPKVKAIPSPKVVAQTPQIKPQKAQGEVLPTKTTKVSPEVKPALKSAKLDTLNPTGSVFADYTPAKRATAELADNITTLDKTMKKPADEMITIYRGTGKGGDIVAGDFVTTNKQLAKDYAGTGVVVEKKVKLSDILDDVNEPLGEEYIYRPKTKPLKSVDDNLIQEAKKYKTADEFIKAQGTPTKKGIEVRDKTGIKLQDPYTAEYLPVNQDGTIRVYHSTTKEGAENIINNGLVGSKVEGGDIYFTTNPKGYGGIGKGKDIVLAFDIDPKKIKFDDIYRGELHLKGNNADIGGIKPVKTKSQLTDIWNKANKKTLPPSKPKPKKQPIKYVPVEKPTDLRKKITTESIVAKPSIPQRIKAETIKSGLEDAFGDIEYYNKVSIKSQADETAKLINEDYDRAIRIAMGQENAPGDLLPESVLIGVKNQAIKSGDTELLINLATAEGGVARESTILGQRIKMLDEGLEDDAFRNIKKVVSERRNNYQKKTGKSVDKAIKQETDKIKEAIKKTAPKKDDWLDFVNSITC